MANPISSAIYTVNENLSNLSIHISIGTRHIELATQLEAMKPTQPSLEALSGYYWCCQRLRYQNVSQLVIEEPAYGKPNVLKR